MNRTFVIGDIHGAYRALQQCLQRSGFDYEKDQLISLGDVCDGWPETKQAIDELMRIKNLTYIFGNHDFWTLEWMRYGHADDVWWEQGGESTVNSFKGTGFEKYQAFLEGALPYHILDNKLFVHAGINPLRPIHQQSLQVSYGIETYHALHSTSIIKACTASIRNMMKFIWVTHLCRFKSQYNRVKSG